MNYEFKSTFLLHLSIREQTLACGDRHTLFIKDDGSLWGMGTNYYGQLGLGDFKDRFLPQKIVDQNVVSVAAGSEFTFFLRSDGSLWGMGKTEYGQFGNGSSSWRTSSPVELRRDIVDIACGNKHSLMLTKDGQLLGAGDNDSGALGNERKSADNKVILIDSGVRSMAAGSYHTLYIKEDQTLWGTGQNGYGQLGLGDKLLRSKPEKIDDDVVDVVSKGSFSLYLKSDGTLWGMGWSSYGALGVNSYYVVSPVMIDNRVLSFTAGRMHTLYVRDDNSLWGVGYNGAHQLGKSTNSYEYKPIQIATNVVAASAGENFSLFENEDSILMGMGSNSDGQLGKGTLSSLFPPSGIASLVPQDPPTLTSPKANSEILTGSSVKIEWTDNYERQTEWILKVSTSPGAGDLYYGKLDGNIYEYTLTVPYQEGVLYVELLWAGGISTRNYKLSSKPTPRIITPSNDSTLSGSEQLFEWDGNGETITFYELNVGTLGNPTWYYDGASTKSTSQLVSNLPLDGSKIVATLRYLAFGESTWKEQVFTYDAWSLTPGVPGITAPANGTTLTTGSEITIEWSENGSAQPFYFLYVGTSRGASDVLFKKLEGVTSQVVTVPSTEGTLYVKLQWPGMMTEVSYPIQDIPTPGITSPAAGSTLTGSDVSFSWAANGATISSYELDIGTQSNPTLYYDGTSTTSTSASVTGLPEDGSEVVASFKYTRQGQSEESLSYHYTAYAPAPQTPGVPGITSPANGSTLTTGSEITIEWSENGSAQPFYFLYVGTSRGASDVLFKKLEGVTSQVVTVPSTEGTLYVKLQWPGMMTEVSYPIQDIPTPGITSPAAGSTLTGSDVSFSWAANGATISSYELDIGTQSNPTLYYDGTSTTSTSASVTGLPEDGSEVVASFKYTRQGQSEESLSYHYTAYAPAPQTPGVPGITSPANGSTLTTGSEITIEWSENGSAQPFYFLYVGTSRGASDVLFKKLEGVTSQVVTVPSTEGTLYVKLQWPGMMTEVSYPIQDIPTPGITSPAAGSTLTGSDVSFSWAANGATISSYELDIGTQSNPTLYYDGTSTTSTSASVTGLPEDGSEVVASFKYTRQGQSEESLSYHYTAYAPAPQTPGVPGITSPANGSTLTTGSEITIEWSENGSAQPFYFLYVGTSRGASDVLFKKLEGVTSQVVTVPSTEGTLYVKLQWPGMMTEVSYTMENIPTPGITSPAAGSTLTGSDVSFSWAANGATISSYELDIGTQSNPTLYYDGTSTTSTSASVTGLPEDGSEVVASFKYTRQGQSEESLSYHYTAYAPAPQTPGVPGITSPANGSTLTTGSEITIEWSENGSAQPFYFLYVGTSRGASDVLFKKLEGVTSQVVTVPSTEGTLYVKLQWPGMMTEVSYPIQDIPTPGITSPAAGSTLTGSDVSFSWAANGATISSYELDIGTQSNPTLYYDGTSTTSTSASVTGLPEDGSEVVASFKYTRQGQSEESLSYHYTAYAPAPQTPGVPGITAPANGTTLTTGSEITIEWSENGSAQPFYFLYVGTSRGASDVLFKKLEGVTSQVVTVPSTEGTLYVKLQWPGMMTEVSYPIQDIPTPGITSPAAGSTLTGSDVSFSWAANGATISSYELDIGTQSNPTLYYDGTSTTSTSASVTGLPEDGSEVVASFKYTRQGQSEESLSYHYTAYAPAPQTPGVPGITSPANGTTLTTGSEITIEWSENGSAQPFYLLYVGTSRGASDVLFKKLEGVTSQVVTVPSAEGTLYVKLQWPGMVEEVSYTMENIPTPGITSPAAGSTLTGSDVSFSWAANGATISSYELDIGTQSNPTLYYDGTSTTSTSASVTGLPEDGSEVVASFKYTRQGQSNSKTLTYSYTSYTLTQASIEMLSPDNGQTLGGPSLTLNMSDLSHHFSVSKVDAGSSLGANDIATVLSPTVRRSISGSSFIVNLGKNLPTDGRQIFVRVYYIMEGSSVTQSQGFELTAYNGDGFNDPFNYWIGISVKKGDWGQHHGGDDEYVVGAPDPDVDTTEDMILYYGVETFKDFDWVTRMRFENGDQHRVLMPYRWSYDYADNDDRIEDCFFVELKNVSTNRLEIRLKIRDASGVEQTLSPAWQVDNFDSMQWFELKVRCNGSQHSVWINDLFLGSVSSDLHNYEGYVGYGIVDDDGATNGFSFVHLDNSQLIPSVAQPYLVSPSPSSKLTGATETFNWSANGSDVTSYELDVGTSNNPSAYHDGEISTSLSEVVDGLPEDGSSILVTFKYLLKDSSQWKSELDYYEAVSL